MDDHAQDISLTATSCKWPPHPAFGRISGTLYGVFISKHFDHHLRQFGV